MLEAQLNYRVEAHKCGLGTLARGTLVTIESEPNMYGEMVRVRIFASYDKLTHAWVFAVSL